VSIYHLLLGMPVHILAIESSCDDTAAAVLTDGIVRSNCVASQEIHRLYGGVVPEVASRAHQSNLVPVVEAAIQQAGISKDDLDAVAFTRGPGLLGSLLVGTAFAKAFALARQIPLIEVDHMDAHVMALFAEPPYPSFPFLCLTVSGGHTQIIRVTSPLEMERIGYTLDDAAGEAFDKAGKMLGLPYPAGPHIDRLAKEGSPRFQLPEPSIEGLNFSFSGLKTAILYFLRRETSNNPAFIQENLADICASIQHSIVTILLKKVKRAAKETGIKQIGIAGGVSANSGLRTELERLGKKEGWNTFIPKFQYCTDNAAMIGLVAHQKYLAGQFASQQIAPYASGQAR
jgi:N6-L-threonylcarbamoyladenine synthase